MTASGPGAEWIARANSRAIGHTEFRQVTMMIGGHKGGRSLEIRTLRQLDAGVCRTLFCVMEPRMFRGVSYVAEESRGKFAMDVILYLPYVVGTVRGIPPDRCGETFLGSDFSYDDMRTWLPEAGFHYHEPIVHRDKVCVRGQRVNDTITWRHRGGPFVVHLDPESAFVTGIDYLDDTDATQRAMRIPARTMIHGIDMPVEIEMATRSTTTTLFLQKAQIDFEVDPVVFARSECARRHDYLSVL